MPEPTERADENGVFGRERQRLLSEYSRRRERLDPELYAPWKASVQFSRLGRLRIAAQMLTDAQTFPRAGDQCLEVGFGSLGWLPDLLGWGVREKDLHGIELDPARARQASEVLPAADLRVGDASALPWKEETFQIVIASTVFTSILEPIVRSAVAAEITRVLATGGALLWYDFAVNNPRNPNVRRVGRAELRRLFPRLRGKLRSVTLAPPLARRIVPWSWAAATLLEALPPLRTHLLAVLVKHP